jgi:hypothetical protein
MIYLDDHDPAHVHVRFDGCSVKVLIAPGAVTLDAVEGKVSRTDERAALRVVADNLDACLDAWSTYHGKE